MHTPKKHFETLLLGAVAFVIASCSEGSTDPHWSAEREEQSHEFEGTWFSMFEGENFFEDDVLSASCNVDFDTAAWLDTSDAEGDRSVILGDLEKAAGTYTSQHGSWSAAVFEVKFIGHRSIENGPAGHLGMWDSEVKVERFISVKPIANVHCNDTE